MDKYKFTVEFMISREQTHTVTIKAWSSDGMRQGETQWHWNVYGHVFETHPWFDKPEVLQTHMPLHYGASLSERRITEPALGLTRDWEKRYNTLVFGSDYNHYTDPENMQSPLEGIPYRVRTDALELAEWLKERA